jgi:competence protein ComEA
MPAKKIKTSVKKYLSITKKEWNGTVVLIVLIMLALAAPYVYQLLHKDKVINFKELETAVSKLEKVNKAEGASGNGAHATGNPFEFDPNNLPDAQWQKLGLSDRQILVIKHYEAKGGRFYRKEDVKKIYSISAKDYKRLEPYIKINTANIHRLKPSVVVEVNSADSAGLTKIYGIGPAFASRIIKYRNRLGGFYSKEQLKEVYGLDAERYAEVREQVRIDPAKVKKVNVNTAQFDDLKRYPYLSYKQINAIVEYRREHGDYSSIADMKNIAILNDRILRKIEPYILFK